MIAEMATKYISEPRRRSFVIAFIHSPSAVSAKGAHIKKYLPLHGSYGPEKDCEIRNITALIENALAASLVLLFNAKNKFIGHMRRNPMAPQYEKSSLLTGFLSYSKGALVDWPSLKSMFAASVTSLIARLRAD